MVPDTLAALAADFPFEWWQAALILLAGVAAGLINTIVGSGTLVTFPVLVTMGVPPVTASMSNAMGLSAGNLTGAWNYRHELAGVERTLLKLIPCSALGGVIGAWLLLHLPETVFAVVAPVLIAMAVLLVIFQPRLSAWVKGRQDAEHVTPESVDSHPIRPVLYVLVFLTGVYGGYFTAAQGVILMAIFGIFLHGTLQQSNAIKVILSLAVNLIAAVSYLLFAFERIDWTVVLLIAVGSLVGGFVGAKVGRRLSPGWLRAVIVVLGLLALVNMLGQLVAA